MAPLLGSLLVRISLAIALGYVAIVTYGQGVIDWEYQLAGQADPFLGHPAPWWTIGIGAILSGLVAVAWFMVRAVGRRSLRHLGGEVPTSEAPAVAPSSGPGGSVPWQTRPIRWWWVLGAAWGAWVVGGVITIAAGGPVDHPGSMRFQFAGPIDQTAEVAATCRPASGKPDVVAQVIPAVDGLPVIGLRNLATGGHSTWVGPDHSPEAVTLFVADDHVPGNDFIVTGASDRVPMYDIWWGVDGPSFYRVFSFVEAYYYRPKDLDDRGASGTVSAEATRDRSGFRVNDLIPDDPWPETYELRIDWSCDMGSRAAPVAFPTPSPPYRQNLPSQSFGDVDPDGVPVELRIVTSSDWTTLRLEGGTIVRSTLVAVEGGAADAVQNGNVFTVTQPLAAASAGRAVGATFSLILADLTSGSTLSVAIAQGGRGITQGTFLNDLGDEPTPVFAVGAQPEPVATPAPMPVPAKWLVLPVAPMAVR